MTKGIAHSVVYEGAVTHQRFKPVSHRLRYKVFSFLLDLDRVDETAKQLRFFSRNKFNLFSFYDRDHGAGRPEDLARYIRGLLEQADINAQGRILLLCYPRMLGYAFNPLSVYYCYDANDCLAAMIYEVSNTFGERHAYLIPAAHRYGRVEQYADKAFHVSPFIDMNMRYHFSITHPQETVSVSIETADPDGPVLNATFNGVGAAVTDRCLISLFTRYPLMTMKVIMGIHWEALKLVLKGLHLRGGEIPDYPVTLVRHGCCETKSAA